MRRLIVALALLLPAACVTPPNPDLVAAAGAPVALGQRAHVGRYVIRPISVYEDSRCPSGVRCIWAGRFILYALVDGPDVHANVYLTLGMPQQVGAGGITLAAVMPERFANVPPKRESYRFVFSGG